jgi:DNA invertase Pin-like site-specific DNA recombinase
VIKRPCLRAVQYIRMSTDLQDLSPALQKVAIAAYAERNGLTILETYLDAGKSGLTLRKRTAMKKLLRDVVDRQCPFSIILVYDISRWGRFQDTDASAYYEYHCRLHGVDVRYVQEPFSDADSPMNALFKSLKRAMAAEYSRELAIKVRAGQFAAIEKGYQVGTSPAIGFARIAVAKADGSERLLGPNEHKAGYREHVKWVLGPPKEVSIVRRIFDLYANTEIGVVDLAKQLRCEGVTARGGRRMTEWMLYGFLRSEAVVGNFVWGRAENKKRRSEDDERFRRVSGFVEPIVSRETFDAVQVKLGKRCHVIYTREILLEQLRAALERNPRLRATDLKAHGCACRETYRKEFGSLAAAWAAGGATYPSSDEQQYAEMIATAHAGARLCTSVASFLVGAGVDCQRHTRADRQGQALLINGKTILRIQVIGKRSRYNTMQWSLRKIYKASFDWVLVVRVDENGVSKDSILLKREQYFAHEKWLADRLVGPWQHHRRPDQIVGLINRLM